ncbi:MAG TPA: hypothetical protein VFG04_09615 [Planctomycetaceae bacterium]|nr:hypothetical protein [Planctomycetaceae bacterium]
MRAQLQSAVAHVATALREPEEFAKHWERGTVAYSPWVWAALLSTAIFGTTTYGMTMGLLGGDVLQKACICTFAAGMAWTVALPALYILNSLGGSRLSFSSTVLAALVTVSWGGLAMVASIPLNWFFLTAVPHPHFAVALNLLIFAGVGVAMADVFRRIMRRLEPDRETFPAWWLLLLTVIGSELFYHLNLFQFSVL